MGIFYLALAVGLIINIIASCEFRDIAAEKGFDGKKYFWYCFWLGFIGYLMVIALPDRKIPQKSIIVDNSAVSPVSQIPSAELPDL